MKPIALNLTLVLAALLIVLIYIKLLRPKLRQRRDIKKIRKWLYEEVGVPSKPLHSKPLPPGVQIITDIREVWGYPPKQNDIFEEINSNDSNEGNYIVHIHEATEQYLGANIFKRLPKRFSLAHGIEKCIQEDRDVFIIETKTLNAQALRESLWTTFLEAAAESFKEDKKDA